MPHSLIATAQLAPGQTTAFDRANLWASLTRFCEINVGQEQLVSAGAVSELLERFPAPQQTTGTFGSSLIPTL